MTKTTAKKSGKPKAESGSRRHKGTKIVKPLLCPFLQCAIVNRQLSIVNPPSAFRTPQSAKLLTGLAFLSVLASADCRADDAKQSPVADAKRVLQQAGVKGGLVVHVGCGDGRLTAALAAGDGYLVHGLDADPENVEAARGHLRSLGVYGKLSVDRFDGQHLPYIDNGVNLLVTEDLGRVSMDEVMRVLSPRGVACVRKGTQWHKTVKPRPDEIDEWTHYLHGPDNNATSHDRLVSSPFHVQWVCGPKWARHHNHLSSTSAMVTSGGRLFAIVDEGPAATLALPPKWMLVARDAFSGVVLWKKPLGPWEGHLRPFRSGPTELARRLVAVGDEVYVTLGYNQPVTALDAATGQIVRTYAETEDAVEIICDGGVLYVVAGTIDPQQYAEALRRGRPSPPPRDKRILAIQAATGKVVWQKSDTDTGELLPTTLCVGPRRVFFQSTSHVVCLDRASGEVSWKAPRPVRTDRLAWSAPTLVMHEDVVLSADCAAPAQASAREGDGDQVKWTVTARTKRGEASMGKLIAFSAGDGKELWRCPTAQGYNAPADVFVADGLVWASYAPQRNTTDFTEGRDLHTGEVKRRLETDAVFTVAHHHRCYRNKATDRFILLGRTGIELIPLDGTKPVRHCWVRGACQYGVMPANGLLYAPPHSCACYIQSKLSGFWALAGRSRVESRESRARNRLEKGPAYGHPSTLNPQLSTPHDWPTFRHDPGRTGRTKATIPAKLQLAWDVDLGGRLSSPVVADGKLLVAAVDTHAVHALDAGTGKQLWRHTVGGRVDSPPTIDRGLAVFGCADGFVYCLRLADGKLVWRFQAAPMDRRIVAFDQIESLWPVTGSVLVHDGVVYSTAGRSSYLDGGMYLHRLDLATGKLLTEKRFYNRDPKTGEQPEAIIEDVEMPGALPDVLVYDGQHVYLRDKVLDLNGEEQKSFVTHLYSSAGLLDDAWWHRTYWLWGERTWGRASGWGVMPRYRPSGRLLVTDETTVFGYGRKRVTGNSLQGYHLFRADKQVKTLDRKIKNNNVALMKYQKPAKVIEHWSREVPLVVRAMVLTDDVLFTAGPVMAAGGESADEPTFDADSPAVLTAFRTEDGQELSHRKLKSQAVFDGLVAAYGKLFLSTVDGKVVCLGAE